nr:hypothetical protein [uncultured Flavobacterium sp.]
MKKIKLLLSVFLFLLINQNLFCQQFDNFNILSFQKSDSIIVSNVYYYDKEFNAPLAENIKPAKKDSITGEWTLPYDDSKGKKDTLFEINRRKLKIDKISSLNKFLQNKNSFNKKGVALLRHYDIEINYYNKGKIFQLVRVSSITNKIIIYREDCKKGVDKNKTNQCLFYGTITKRFMQFISSLKK